MKKKYLYIIFLTAISSAVILLSSFKEKPDTDKAKFSFPYKAAGLTERQAAAHLISRFSFGATPGMVDEVVKTGLENWFAQQLQGGRNDEKMNELLSSYTSLRMSNNEIGEAFPDKVKVLRATVEEGLINKDSLSKFPNENFKKYQPEMLRYLASHHLKPQAELARELIIQKILRAAYSNNQLQETMTAFWFNHFNITLGRADCARFATVYEQQTIRPNVLGKFETLLTATAQSPAMLLYLDNASSIVNRDDMEPQQQMKMERREEKLAGRAMEDSTLLKKIKKTRRSGINENYAREVMELHTLGVDGGYTQEDVTSAAKIFTGWTIYPMKDYGGKQIPELLEKLGPDRAAKQGYFHQNDFVFLPNRHDKNAKTVLGNQFPAGGGYEEGVRLIHFLSHHPSTAKFISYKLACRFVSDVPPASLVAKMAKTFTEKEGDISQVLTTMVSSPEFWAKEALREKTKSPFELVISAVRCLNAEITQPYQLFSWLNKMGEKIYYYQPPTGFPDRGQYWINTGSLLSRMNFGLALATQRVPGVKLNLLALNNNHEPESPQDALIAYSKLLMPERDMAETIKRLTPLLNDPELVKKVNEAAAKNVVQKTMTDDTADDDAEPAMMMDADGQKTANGKMKKVKNPKNDHASMDKMLAQKGNYNMLAQVVGVILGSPEFQRR